MSPSGSNFDRAFDMLLTFDLAEIKFLFAGSRLEPTIGRADRFERNISAQKMHHLRKRTCPVHLEPSTTAAFCGILQ